MRLQIGQLRPELFQLFVHRPANLPVRFPQSSDSLQRTILANQCFEIDTLLFGGIERILFGLKLGLQPGQNLQITAYLGWQFLPGAGL